MISALFTVRTDTGIEEGLDGFAESYRTWSQRSRFPGLVATVRVYQVQETGMVVSEFDPEAEAFDMLREPLSPEVAQLASQIADHIQGRDSLPIDSTVRVLTPIGNADVAAIGLADRNLVLGGVPTPTITGRVAATDLTGYLVAEIDREYLASVMLPTLVADHVPLASKGGDFVAAIVDPEEQSILYSSETVTAAELFGDAHRHFDDEETVAFSATIVAADVASDAQLLRDDLPPPDDEPPRGIDRDAVAVLRHPVLQMWLGRRGLDDGRDTVFFGPDSRRRLDVQPSLQLVTWHRAGSIAEGVVQARNRNIGVSAVVLLILAGAIVLLYAMLLRSLRLRDQEREFIASVTHELRTPISAMYATSENLAHGIVSADDRVIEYGRLLLEEGARLRTMIEQVLLFAGLGAAHQTLHLEPVEVDDLIDRVVTRVPEADDARLSLEVSRPIPPIAADRVALESLLCNLVSNAFKHNDERVSVSVSARHEPNPRGGKFLVIAVADTGRGIPRAERARVTEPFFRGSWSTRQQIPGSGLGLSLSARISALHGGTLRLQCPPTGGTTVTVTIPSGREEAMR